MEFVVHEFFSLSFFTIYSLWYRSQTTMLLLFARRVSFCDLIVHLHLVVTQKHHARPPFHQIKPPDMRSCRL